MHEAKIPFLTALHNGETINDKNRNNEDIFSLRARKGR
jgi:hypothetical protein